MCPFVSYPSLHSSSYEIQNIFNNDKPIRFKGVAFINYKRLPIIKTFPNLGRHSRLEEQDDQ